MENNKLVAPIATLNKYKYTVELESDMKDYGKYEQFIDIEEIYNNKKEEKDMRLGLFGSRSDDPRAIPGLTVICGMTGHGKSMLGNTIAYKAVREGKNVLYITLEVNKEDMFYQMLSIESYVDGKRGVSNAISHSDMKKKSLLPEQEKYVFNELWPAFKSMKGNLHVLSEFDFDVSDTVSLQNKMMEVEDYSIAKSGKGIDMVIVDYIQLFKTYSRGQSASVGEYAVLTNWVNDFRKMSLNYLGENREIPIILLSQLNRDAWADEKMRQKKSVMKVEMVPANSSSYKEVVISISQIAGCTEIAKAAKQIIAIYADEGFKASHQCLISILKSRNDRTHLEPIVSYMNPKYYVAGHCADMDESFDGTMDDILGSDVTLDLSKNPFATMGEL